MKVIDLLNLRRKDPSKIDGSYQESLVNVTKNGTVIAAYFFLFFALLYLIGPYPPQAIWVNIIAATFSIFAYFSITQFNRHRAAAHLMTSAIYISSTGLMCLSGGIHSSSANWQFLVPVTAFITAGLWAGLRWGFICLVTIVAFFLLEANGVASFSNYDSTLMDQFIDLSSAVIALSVAIWYSDSLKSRALRELEKTKEQLNFYATIDPLTNTYNRRHFINQSEKKIQRINMSQGYVSFLLFDIDHFKQTNDSHGHMIGDQILRGVAKTCKQYLRPDDILGRFGGEEFVVLLPETNVGNARNIADRLRSLIERTPIETDIGDMQVTISIGVAVMDKSQQATLEQLIRKADQAMYKAKQAGRNKVMVWEEQMA